MTKISLAFRSPGFVFSVLAIGLFATFPVSGQSRRAATLAAVVPKPLLLQIVRAEDERHWDGVLAGLLSHQNAAVRSRAALAAGRIGNELAVPALVSLMQSDKDPAVRSMAIFALGEIESAKAVEPLTAQIANDGDLRGRIVEALGKIAAALPQTSDAQKKEIGKTILEVLSAQSWRRSFPDTEVTLLALTATLRTRPEGAGPVVAEFLSYSDPRIRSDAGNTLARLRAADGNAQLRKLLTSDPDPNVRANAARVLGATEDKAAFDGLVRALNDADSRVRISTIRALSALKDPRATASLMLYGTEITMRRAGPKADVNELLEIATALGRLAQDSKNENIFGWVDLKRGETGPAPELEIALARISPAKYLSGPSDATEAKQKFQVMPLVDWRMASSLAQGLGEIAAVTKTDGEDKQIRKQAEDLLRLMLDYRNAPIKPNTLVAVHSEYAIPDVLRALAAFKPANGDSIYRDQLKEPDMAIRTTAAELLGELPTNKANVEALSAALRFAQQEKDSNDAALAILDALGKAKDSSANQAIMSALDSPDYLVRRKAVDALKAGGAGDFSHRIGSVGTRNSTKDYERALARIGKRVRAIVTTNKGRFTIELLPREAPLNVDNFVQLAKRGYFNRIIFHRVVPNFVIQAGDPRGDGNGGPGYQIRCEINEVSYGRGAVGMALSGKDTGGSQWFVTHAPQPHLDGGYTVFGNVIAGMDVVDKIARGDVINSIIVREGPALKP